MGDTDFPALMGNPALTFLRGYTREGRTGGGSFSMSGTGIPTVKEEYVEPSLMQETQIAGGPELPPFMQRTQRQTPGRVKFDVELPYDKVNQLQNIPDLEQWLRSHPLIRGV